MGYMLTSFPHQCRVSCTRYTALPLTFQNNKNPADAQKKPSIVEERLMLEAFCEELPVPSSK
jgi:hypothetical protein